MGVAAHEAAGDVAVGDEQDAFGEFVFLGGRDRDFDRLAVLAGEPHAVALRETEPLHVAGSDLQRVDLVLVFVLKFPLANAATLVARSAGDEDEGFGHGGTGDSGQGTGDSIVAGTLRVP